MSSMINGLRIGSHVFSACAFVAIIAIIIIVVTVTDRFRRV